MANVKAPVLAKAMPATKLDVLDGADLEGARVDACELAKAHAAHVRFEGVALVGGTMSESRVDALSWMDVRCDRLDVSLAEWPRATSAVSS